MKIECTRDNLKKAVSATERVTGKNLPLPVLGAIFCKAEGKLFSLHATNLDVGVIYTVPARVEQKGGVAIPANILSGFMQNISRDAKINLELVGTTISIKTDHNTAVVKTLPTEDFPEIKKLSKEEAEATFALPPDLLCSAIKSVVYAAAISDIKPEIASINIKSVDDNLIFVATDSFRLAEKKIPHKKLKKAPENDFSVLLPIKNAGDLLRTFTDTKEVVEVLVSKNQLSCDTTEVYFTSRLIAASFPNLSQVFPTKTLTEATVDRADIAEALKMSSVFSDKFNRVQVRVMPTEGLFEVSARTGEAGESTGILEAVLTGEEIEMNFNAKYILDVFNSIFDNKIIFLFSGKDRPVLVRGSEDASFTYLLMPLHS